MNVGLTQGMRNYRRKLWLIFLNIFKKWMYIHHSGCGFLLISIHYSLFLTSILFPFVEPPFSHVHLTWFGEFSAHSLIPGVVKWAISGHILYLNYQYLVLGCTHENKTDLDFLLKWPGKRHYFMLSFLSCWDTWG